MSATRAPDAGGADLADPTASQILLAHRRQDEYRRLLLDLFVAVKAAQYGGTDETSFAAALDRFAGELAASLDREGTLFVGERGGHLYVNGVRVRVDADAFAAQRFLVQTLVLNQCEGLLFERGVDVSELAEFIDTLCRAGRPEGACSLLELVSRRRIEHVHPVPRGSEGGDPITLGRESIPRGGRTFLKSVFVLRHALACVPQICVVGSREARRALQLVVSHLLEDGDAALALDRLRETEPATFAAGVHRAVLAVALASRLDLPRNVCAELAAIALYGDPETWPHEPTARGVIEVASAFEALLSRDAAIPPQVALDLLRLDRDLDRNALAALAVLVGKKETHR